MISLDTNILIQQGVTVFATVNEKDFRDCGLKPMKSKWAVTI